MTALARLRVELGGVVQGVGFRPLSRRLAAQHGVSGQVRNTGLGVELEIEGGAGALGDYLDALLDATPGGAASILRSEALPVRGDRAFVILESSAGAGRGPSIPPDRAACAACLHEIEGPGRRRGYPFTSCTACGPRWSVALASPWDRERTTMARFGLCEACAAEAADPSDRRAHAQTLACPRCGPTLWLETAEAAPHRGEAALLRAVELVRAGAILGLKAVGGWQLVCDATDERAVARLRVRKAREARPLAVLFSGVEEVAPYAELREVERAALLDAAAPIVLVRARRERRLAPSVAPDSCLVGALLPASPLHLLLAQGAARPLVCTSGNRSDEPLAVEDDDARVRLSGLADVLLGHDRAIARPLDDSVVRFAGPQRVVLRRARGLVPRALPRLEPGPVVLALGAHLKSTVALATRDAIWLSAHGGDLGSPRAVDRLAESARELLAWSSDRPDVVACDLHPDYASSALAEQLARELGVPLVRVQHHAAHVAAVVAERGLVGPVLGLAWDGSGLGDDGTLWGGEALLLEGGHATRLAALRSFRLPGGDAAARDGRRAALGVLLEAGLAFDGARLGFGSGELDLLSRAHSRGVNSPRCSSLGRLFDAVAAITSVCTRSRFEGEAAMAFEQAALDEPIGATPYPLPLEAERGGPWQLDWAPLVSAILRDIDAGVPVARISARFHASLAHGVAAVVEAAAQREVALAGGCFQNARLVEETCALLSRPAAAACKVHLPGELPPGDGAIAVGQALLAARRNQSDVLGATR